MGAWRSGVYLGRIMAVHDETVINGGAVALVTIRPLGDKDFKTWVNVNECEVMD